MDLLHKEEFGAHWFVVTTKSGLRVCLCDIGASVFQILYKDICCLYTTKTNEDFINSIWFYGKTLGRVAGRVLSPIIIDGQKYKLPTIPYSNVCLHSGTKNSLSYDKFAYEIVKSESKDKISIIFRYEDKDLVRGFPGNCKITITYDFDDTLNSFKIKFHAISDKKTYINLSNHMYFNFNKDYDMSNYFIKFNAHECGLIDKDLLIVGKRPIAQYLNFNGEQSAKEQLELLNKQLNQATIDNLVIFDKTKNNQNIIELKNKDIELKVKTTYPGFNFFINENKAIAIEPQKIIYDLDSITYDKDQEFLYESEYEFNKLD